MSARLHCRSRFPIWSHEVDAVKDPTSGRYVAFYSSMAHGKAPPCTACRDGSTSKSCKKLAADATGHTNSSQAYGKDMTKYIPSIGEHQMHSIKTHCAGQLIWTLNKVSSDVPEVSPPTFMSHSLTDNPRGPWSKPTLVLMPKPMMDINAAPVIKPDGSLVGMWRDHHPSGKYSTPHLFTASNWSDPATYVLRPLGMRSLSKMPAQQFHVAGLDPAGTNIRLIRSFQQRYSFLHSHNCSRARHLSLSRQVLRNRCTVSCR